MNQVHKPGFIIKKHDLEYVDATKATYRFDDWNDEAANHLKAQGFVVIKNILTLSEINHAKSLLWKFLCEMGWKIDDPMTWTDRKYPGETIRGIIWGHGAGQSSFQWYLRTRKRIVKTFASCWSSQEIYKKQNIIFDYAKDMITSFDGFSVFRPWYLNGCDKWKTQGGWYHIDQNVVRSPNIETIQGIVSLYDQNESTGSTVFIPGSHKWVNRIVTRLTIYSHDFVPIPKQFSKLNKMKKLLLCCVAGDLVLWDSRTIHCNSPSLLTQNEMQKIHLNDININIDEKKDNNPLSISVKTNKKRNKKKKKQWQKQQVLNMLNNKNHSIKTSKNIEKEFINKMKEYYLKPNINKNILCNDLNGISYNGYNVSIILWQSFNINYFNDGKSYIFILPWNTSFLWIPNWFDESTANNLKKLILNKIKFNEPILKYDKINKNGEIISINKIKQSRKSAWISNYCDKKIQQNRNDSDILSGIKTEEWSNCLLKHASLTSTNEFNSMLLDYYTNGRNSSNLHCYNSDNLGDISSSIIGSAFLGAKRTLFIKSKEVYNGTNSKIEIKIPLMNGSFFTMNAGFQKYWLHSLPKNQNVNNDSINILFKKYSLSLLNDLDNNINDLNDNKLFNDENYIKLLRVASYICMVPKIKIKNQNIIKERIKSYETNDTCSHWPQQNHVLFTTNDLQNKSIKNVKNDLKKSLIGLPMLNNNYNWSLHKNNKKNIFKGKKDHK